MGKKRRGGGRRGSGVVLSADEGDKGKGRVE